MACPLCISLLAEISRRWGGRMIARGATTAWEEWSQNGSRREGPFHGFLRSHSHAWSAAPAAWLLRALAGFSILAPGRGRLAPYHAPWPWSLTLPLPGGCLAVQWDPLGGAAVSARGVDCRPGPEGIWEVAWRTEGPRSGPGGCSIDEIGFMNPG